MGTFAAGMMMGIVGRLFDHYGHRKMSIIIAACFGGALFFMSTVNSVIMLLIGFFFIRLFGQGSMGLISGTLVPQWFIRRKGRAMSIVSVFGALSWATFPVMNIWLIQNFGWRNGWRFWMLVIWFLTIPLFYYFIRNRPEDVGFYPDNEMLPKSIDGEVSVYEEASWAL
jgi:MFS family permease